MVERINNDGINAKRWDSPCMSNNIVVATLSEKQSAYRLMNQPMQLVSGNGISRIREKNRPSTLSLSFALSLSHTHTHSFACKTTPLMVISLTEMDSWNRLETKINC